jgi:hypothetical protein
MVYSWDQQSKCSLLCECMCVTWQGQVESSCDCGNEPSGSIKCWGGGILSSRVIYLASVCGMVIPKFRHIGILQHCHELYHINAKWKDGRWMMNWKGFGEKWSWHKWSPFLATAWWGLSKTMINLDWSVSQPWFKWSTSWIEVLSITNMSTRSVTLQLKCVCSPLLAKTVAALKVFY